MREIVGDFGGGGNPNSPKQFFYLVANWKDPGNFSHKDMQNFFSLGAGTDSEFVFVFIDISTDGRLEKELLKHEGGPAFYEKLKTSAPAFVWSKIAIPNLLNISELEMFPIVDYSKDVEAIHDRIGKANKQDHRLRCKISSEGQSIRADEAERVRNRDQSERNPRRHD